MRKHYLFILILLFAVNSYSQAIDGPAGPDRGVCPGGSVTIGGTVDNGSCYSWKATPDDPAFIDLKSAKITVSPKQTTTYTLTIIGENFSSISTDEVTVQVLQGFNIALTRKIVCDGEEVEISVTTDPPDNAFGDFIKCLKGNITFASNPIEPFFGNPLGLAILEFDPLDNNGKSKIKNAIWYSTIASHCNDKSEYEIKASANFHGVIINSNANILAVEATLGDCLDGGIIPPDEINIIADQWFSGNFDTTWIQVNGNWQGTLATGTFKKDVFVKVSNLVNPNSQFFNMVQAEEEFHKGQWEGNLSIYFIDLFSPQMIVDAINNRGPFIGATKAEVASMIQIYSNTAQVNEIVRSLNEIAIRGCGIEAEAKNFARSSYKVKIECSYPQCK